MGEPENDAIEVADPVRNKDNGYHLNDFLNYHDKEFVVCAHQWTLSREPDADEVEHFLSRLRLGEMSKAEILGKLRYSPEGRARGVKIRGLFWPFTLQSSFKIPLFGYFLRLTVGILNFPTILRNLQTLETTVFAQLQRQQEDVKAEEPLPVPGAEEPLPVPGAEEPLPVPGAEVPLIRIGDLLPNSVSLALCELESVDGNISVLELMVLCSLIRKQSPRTCFEIGTFDGRTVLNLAANMERGTQIYTLDLPATSVGEAALKLEEADKKYICKERSGMRFEHTQYSDRIIQLFGDSATFDYSFLKGRMDFVFIDGSHSYEYVLSDSRTALRLLGPNGGTVLWHDYDTPYWPGVTRALNELYTEDPMFGGLRRVQDTSLCILQLESDAVKNIGAF